MVPQSQDVNTHLVRDGEYRAWDSMRQEPSQVHRAIYGLI